MSGTEQPTQTIRARYRENAAPDNGVADLRSRPAAITLGVLIAAKRSCPADAIILYEMIVALIAGGLAKAASCHECVHFISDASVPQSGRVTWPDVSRRCGGGDVLSAAALAMTTGNRGLIFGINSGVPNGGLIQMRGPSPMRQIRTISLPCRVT